MNVFCVFKRISDNRKKVIDDDPQSRLIQLSDQLIRFVM